MVYTEALESLRLFQREAVKEQSCKRGAVGTKSAGGIDMIFALLEGLLGGLQDQGDWLWLGGRNLCRTLSSSEGLSWCTWRKLGWKLDLMHLLVRESLVRRSFQEHLNHCA